MRWSPGIPNDRCVPLPLGACCIPTIGSPWRIVRPVGESCRQSEVDRGHASMSSPISWRSVCDAISGSCLASQPWQTPSRACATKQFALGRQSASLIIGKPKSPFAMEFTKHTNLFLLILDNLQLMLVDPSCQRDQQQMPGKHVHDGDCTTVTSPESAEMTPSRSIPTLRAEMTYRSDEFLDSTGWFNSPRLSRPCHRPQRGTLGADRLGLHRLLPHGTSSPVFGSQLSTSPDRRIS